MVQLTNYLKVEISGSVPILSSVTQTHPILLLLHYQHVGFPYLCLRLHSAKIAATAPNIMSSQQHCQHKRRGRLFTNKLSLHISELWLGSKAFCEGMQQTTYWLKLRHMATSLHCRGKCNCHWFGSFAVVTSGCHTRIPQTRWHKQQKFISHSMGG